MTNQMSHQNETNPHFLPTTKFSSQTPPPQGRSRPPPIRHQQRASIELPQAPRPQPPLPPVQAPQYQGSSSTPPPQSPPYQGGAPPHRPQPHQQNHRPINDRGHTTNLGPNHHDPSLLHGPETRKTRPIAWLLAAFCALFWIILIVGGLIILIVYLVFRPSNPRFDIAGATFNAAYLDLGYLLDADITLLANFTNPSTKVSVDLTYIVLDLYYENNFIATRYVEPFSLLSGQSHFDHVDMMTSHARLSLRHIMDLKKQVESGRVNFQIRGMFKTKSRFGGLFQYSYRLYVHCRIAVTGPPTGALIGKKCVTKR